MIGRLLERTITAACVAAAKRLPAQIICRAEGDPYLGRFYLCRREWFPKQMRSAIPGVYLHFFYRGDGDGELHNHPWSQAVSLVLTGGYFEERRVPGTDRIVHRKVTPGSVNFIAADDFHRVDLLDPAKGCWTLFVTSERVQQWGFWSPDTLQYLPWFEHLRRRGLLGASERAVDAAMEQLDREAKETGDAPPWTRTSASTQPRSPG
jgi:hypothetical protein